MKKKIDNKMMETNNDKFIELSKKYLNKLQEEEEIDFLIYLKK